MSCSESVFAFEFLHGRVHGDVLFGWLRYTLVGCHVSLFFNIYIYIYLAPLSHKI